MSASMGVAVEIVVKAAAASTAPIEPPRATSAVSSGSPAASSEPKVTMSTRAAKSTPKPSMIVMPNSTCWNTCPPYSTLRPAPSRVDAVSRTPSSICSVTSSLGTSNCTCTIAVLPFSLTA